MRLCEKISEMFGIVELTPKHIAYTSCQIVINDYEKPRYSHCEMLYFLAAGQIRN